MTGHAGDRHPSRSRLYMAAEDCGRSYGSDPDLGTGEPRIPGTLQISCANPCQLRTNRDWSQKTALRVPIMV
jgi:hypothetical protein